MPKTVSIIIRGKNEEDWLGLCIKSIREQSFKDFEIIYVDSGSKDASVKIAKEYNVDKIKSIKKFLPGNAINIGIKESSGKYIVVLSAHCIPSSKYWLSRMVKSIKPKNIAGVYGRQLPLSSTSSDDARDLLVTFGNENKIQKKDPFFHNANSIIKRSVWSKVNFDDKISNIEDRDWAKKVIKLGLHIKYDSKASVFHFHGLHQHNNYESFRAAAVNELIQQIDEDPDELPLWLKTENRICPIIFYGKSENTKKDIQRYLKANPDIQNSNFFYYGFQNPKIKNVSFLKRRVSRRVSFDKFTLDVLNLVNIKVGFKIEALSFVDLTYKDFIKNSYIKNKNKIFTDGIHFSSFAYLDKGEVWARKSGNITPLKDMFDSKTQFLRIAFGQGSILRASTIRTNKSNANDGFAYTFDNIKYLIR